MDSLEYGERNKVSLDSVLSGECDLELDLWEGQFSINGLYNSNDMYTWYLDIHDKVRIGPLRWISKYCPFEIQGEV